MGSVSIVDTAGDKQQKCCFSNSERILMWIGLFLLMLITIILALALHITITRQQSDCSPPPSSAPNQEVVDLLTSLRGVVGTIKSGIDDLTQAVEELKTGTAAGGSQSSVSTPASTVTVSTRTTVMQGHSTSCKQYLDMDPTASSGEYFMNITDQTHLQVYCEMTLNGGGYTFLDPASLPNLTDSYLQTLFTDRTTFLMRVRLDSGLQSYGVLRQLTRFSWIPLHLSLNSNIDYVTPVNFNFLGLPYVYYGFLPIATAAASNTHGLTVNGVELTYQNCGANNSHMTLFPNFNQQVPTTYGLTWAFPFTDQLFGSLVPTTPGRAMPEKYFMFMEIHWGGCGTYTQTDGRASIHGIQAVAIGFR